MLALRRTAIRLKLDQGAGLREMCSFLDSQREPGETKRHTLKHVPPLPLDEPAAGAPPSPPGHSPYRFTSADRVVKHGLHARYQPPQEVQAVLAEDIHGLAEEIAGLRGLARGLLALHAAAGAGHALQLGDAYTRLAARLAHLLETEKGMGKARHEAEWVARVEALLEWNHRESGLPGAGKTDSGEDKLHLEPLPQELDSRQLTEEIAATRCILRRTLALASAAQGAQEPKEYIHLVEVYSKGCNRLVRLLQAQGDEGEHQAALLQAAIDQALQEVIEELGVYV
jgi:hypothetical protein